jgi:hypothetical protein
MIGNIGYFAINLGLKQNSLTLDLVIIYSDFNCQG